MFQAWCEPVAIGFKFGFEALIATFQPITVYTVVTSVLLLL